MNLGADTPTACGPGGSLVTDSLTGFSSIITVDPRGRPMRRIPPLSPGTGSDARAAGVALVESPAPADVAGGVGTGGGTATAVRRALSAASFGVRAAVVSRSAVVSERAAAAVESAAAAESAAAPIPGANPCDL